MQTSLLLSPYCGIKASISVLLADLKEIFCLSAQQIFEIQPCLSSCDALLLLVVLKSLAKIVVKDLSLCRATEQDSSSGSQSTYDSVQ